MRSSDYIYADQAATSFPKPKEVTAALEVALGKAGGNPGRSGHRMALAAAEGVYACREAICRLLDAPDPSGVIFTKNATEALNLAIAALTDGGGHVLISDMEHNAVFRPIYRLAAMGKISYDIYKTDRDMEKTVKAVRAAFRRDTVLVVANHASNICSRVLPIAEIGALCQRMGCRFLVDGSQSVGHLPLSVRRMNIDVLCAPAHKGLYGIQGAGFALFRELLPFPPFLVGGSGIYSRSPTMPEEYPEHFEAGTLPTPAIMALHAGIGVVEKRGIAAIGQHISRLSSLLLKELSCMKGIELVPEEECHSGILSFRSPDRAPEAMAEALDRQLVGVRAGLHCAPLAHRAVGTLATGTVRISLGMTNTEEECLSLCRRLHSILGQ